MARREGSAAATGMHKNAQPLAWAMLLVRIFIGAKFLESGVQQWGWLGTDRLRITLTSWTTGESPAAFSSYLPFLTRFIIPHAPVYTYLVVLGELAVGALLVVGFATRLVALPALFLSTNFLLATWNIGYEWQGINECFLTMELAILLSGAGRFGGLDAPLARKHPKAPIW